MLSLGQALIYAYCEGASWKNWLEDSWIAVGSARMLVKVVEAFLAGCCPYEIEDFGRKLA